MPRKLSEELRVIAAMLLHTGQTVTKACYGLGIIGSTLEARLIDI